MYVVTQDLKLSYSSKGGSQGCGVEEAELCLEESGRRVSEGESVNFRGPWDGLKQREGPEVICQDLKFIS